MDFEQAQVKLARLLAVYPNSPRHPVTRHVRKSLPQWALLLKRLPAVLDAIPTEVGTYRLWAKHLEEVCYHGFSWPVRRLLLERAPVVAVSMALGEITKNYLETGRGLAPGTLSLISRRLQEPTLWQGAPINDRLTALRVQMAEVLAARAPWSHVARLLPDVALAQGLPIAPDPVANRLIRSAVNLPAALRSAYYTALLPQVQWDQEQPDRALVLSLFTSSHAYRGPDAIDQPVWDLAWGHASPALRSAVLFQGMVRQEKWGRLAQLDDGSVPLRIEDALGHPLWNTAPGNPAMFWGALDAFDRAPGHEELKDRLWASLNAEQRAHLPQTLARHRQHDLDARPGTLVPSRRRRT